MPTAPTAVVVHPLVLLSVVDHYNRVAKDSRRRVVGVLLGSTFQGKVDITNSYAVPFEEHGDTWYLDHAYLTHMFSMFKKVAGTCRLQGCTAAVAMRDCCGVPVCAGGARIPRVCGVASCSRPCSPPLLALALSVARAHVVHTWCTPTNR